MRGRQTRLARHVFGEIAVDFFVNAIVVIANYLIPPWANAIFFFEKSPPRVKTASIGSLGYSCNAIDRKDIASMNGVAATFALKNCVEAMVTWRRFH